MSPFAPSLPPLLVGFDGKSVPPGVARRLSDGTFAGIVLFARNVEGPRQVRDLCREIKACRPRGGPSPLIAIDQEGGRVRRLKDEGFTQLPPARCYSLFCCHGERAAEGAGAVTGTELRSVGVDINFAPVLDVESRPGNPVIGDRAFASDPDAAAALAIAFARGTLAAGVVPVGKHFPGHGATAADSHHELPVSPDPRRTLLARDLLPFRRAVRNGIPALMTAHVLYPALDPENPATLSRAILVDLLRRDLRFRGIVFSDALEMRAIAERMGTGAAAVAALRAGCDALLVCRGDEALQEQAIASLARGLRDVPALRRAAATANRRLRTLREILRRPGTPPGSIRRVGARKHRELAALLRERWESAWPASRADRSGSIGEG